MKRIIALLIGWVIMAGAQTFDEKVNTYTERGDFAKAEKRIDRLFGSGKLSETQKWELTAHKAILKRIRLDFKKGLDDELPVIREYFPDVTGDQLKAWEKTGALECMVIDGKKKYFSSAARNLFRIDAGAKAAKDAKDKPGPGTLALTCDRIIPMMADEARESGNTLLKPVRMRLDYTVTLDADAVPDGETVRCWLPFPREDRNRQTDVKLISLNDDEYIIASDENPQRSLYTEKTAVAGEPLVFHAVFEITARPEVHLLTDDMIHPYDKNSDVYKKYTAERETHIIFTPEIRALSEKIVGDETRPLQVARKLFKYISDNYPWASAREYSTIPNIPSYVMKNSSGDCGQVTLLFLTLCRYNGIPAKWQSGWMLHPGDINLHDWGEIYFEGVGWVPADQSFGMRSLSDTDENYFYLGSMDPYRLIVNDDYSRPFFPAKTWLRSETVDFQRGELEWKGGNLYFSTWDWHMDVEYLDDPYTPAK